MMNRKALTPRERVVTALQHHEIDRHPKGELLVEEAFLDRLYPEQADEPYPDKMKCLIDEVGIDLVSVKTDDEKGMGNLRKLADQTPSFIMGLVDGLFWNPADPVSFRDFITGIYKGDEGIKALIQMKKKKTHSLIRNCIDNGAQGIIIGDDLAYNRGPFVSPEDLSKWIFPGHRELVEAIKSRNRVAFLHCCGNLNTLLDLILSVGFDGLHGLAPSAGNDPETIRQVTEKRLILMGIIEVDRWSPGEIKKMKKEVIQSFAANGGYILGSSEGLSLNTPIDSFRALYL